MNRIGSLSSKQGRRWLLTAALAVLVAGVAAPSAVAQDLMHARVSFDSGGAMVKGSTDEDWSYATTNTLVMPGDTLWVDQEGTLEVEMSGGTFLRMADGSKADIVSLPPSGVIQGWAGAFYIQRIARSNGSIIFETPVAAVHVQNDTQVRFDILSNGATTVSVHWGAATIRVSGSQDTLVQTGQRVFIDPGYLPSLPEPFDRDEEDSFDTWNRERARLLAVGFEAVPTTVIKEVPVGAADLSTYGEWVTIENDYYWRPTVVTDYVPYRYGHWSFVPSIGYSWVGDYPFGYVTSHYGRWRHHPSYGWCWRYRDGWGPAWVASVRYGPNFVWSPLDPWDRPVVFGHDYYYVGGLQFSVLATSYVHSDYLLYGRRYINPFTTSIVYGIPNSQINIWNININTRRPHFPYPDRSIPVRDYSPRRVIRGPVSLEREGTLARARVTNLESRIGRQRFTPSTATVRRSVRTTVQPSMREASARRSVRLTPEASSPTPGVRGRTLATSDIGGIRSRGRTTERAPSAPSEGVSPRATTPGRGRTTAPEVRRSPDEGRSIRQAPDGPGVPTQRSPGSRDRSVRGVDTRTGPSVERPSTETPSVRGRSAPGTVRERTSREPVRVRTSEPGQGQGRQETPSVRTPSRSTPSPRSVELPRSVDTPRSAPPSVRSTPAPSPRSVDTPRSAPPSVRTTPSPSRGRASVRVAPQAPSGSRVMGRSSAPSVRTAPSPRAQAPSPSVRMAPSPRPQAQSPSVRSAPRSPQVSRPQMSRPSQPSVRQAPSMPSPSPRMSAPDRGSSPSYAPSGGGMSRGSIGGGNRGSIGGSRGSGGDGGRSSRGRSR